MQKFIRIIIILTIQFTFNSCNDDISTGEYYLIGDSITQLWDIKSYFPSLIIHNYGVSGYKLNDLNKINSKILKNKNIIAVIGTNDIGHLNEDSIQNYTNKYVKYFKSIEAKKIYLFSILPNSYNSNSKSNNILIKKINKSIQNVIINETDNIYYIDVYPLFIKDGLADKNLFIDGLHPNDMGYQIMSQLLKKAMK